MSQLLPPHDLKDYLSWWLNPLEKPPQKILELLPTGQVSQVLTQLEQEGLETTSVEFDPHNPSVEDLPNNIKFNLVYGLKIPPYFLDQSTSHLLAFLKPLNQVLRPSSHLVLEILADEATKEGDSLAKLTSRLSNIGLEVGFVHVENVTPTESFKEAPFRAVNFREDKLFWLAFLTEGSDEDVTEWLDQMDL